MSDVGLLEAWRMWHSGKPTQDLLLWGVPILWWGRTGKIVEFVSAFAIIVEIVGPDRLRAFGNSLHGKFSLATAKDYIRDALTWFKVYTTNRPPQKYKADKLNFFVALMMTAIWTYYVLSSWPFLPFWKSQLLVNVGFIIIFFVISLPMTILVVFIGVAVGMMIDFVIIEPAAWVLERESIEKWVKVSSILLLAAGFHFDLLAS